MGRKRTTNKAVKVPRLHRKHNAWYYVTSTTPRQWIRLSDDYHEALHKWAMLEKEHAVDSGTVADMIAKYRINYLPTLKERTQKDYAAYLATLKQVFGDAKPHQVKPHHIAKYLDTHKHAVMANREIAVLSGVYSFGMRWGMCDANPCRGIKRNKEKSRDRYIEDHELNAAIQAAPAQLSLMIQFAYLTALDMGDILTLRYTDIRDGVMRTARGKTQRKVTVRVTPAVKELLDASKRMRRRVSSVHIFPNQDGQGYTADGFKSNWQRFKRRLGFDWTFKDIRAKALTDVSRERGRDAAQALAAHASGNTTEVYIRARDRVITDPVR